jgi:CRP-like cAMP-binding protein
MSHSETSSRQRSPFWSALDPIERDAFRSVATTRTFAAGARLMSEGEYADYALVILSGLVNVFANENDTERLLAVRGPGQLVGERAVLKTSVRSATIIASVPVQALVVRTTDFAAFLSAHPRVLDAVQDQIFDRLVEAPRTAADPGVAPDATPRVRYFTEKTARRLTGLAVAVGGEKRAWRAEEFLADLARGTIGGDAPVGWAQLRHASGLIFGALRLRVRDACKPLMRLLDWSLAKPRTERIVAVLTILTAVYFWWASGFAELMNQLVNVAVVASTIAPALWLRRERGIPPALKRDKKSTEDSSIT